MIRVTVVYPRNEGSRFDAAYWLGTHMPLVGAKLPGVSWEADLAGADQPHYAIAFLTFPSMVEFGAAMGSADGAEVVADMANYTDVQPAMYISEVAARS